MKGNKVFELLSDTGIFIILGANEALCYGFPNEECSEEGGMSSCVYTMDLMYNTPEGLSYEYNFIWDEDEEIATSKNTIFLTDTEGDEIGIVILEIKKL